MKLSSLVAVLLAAVFAVTAFADAPKAGDKAPDFKLTGSDGKEYSLADFAGKKAVVDRLVSQGVHRRLHGRVQEHEGRRRSDPQV